MNQEQRKRLELWPYAMIGLGLLPALAILMFFSFKDGELFFAGRSAGPYDLRLLLAALTSTALPLLLLAPPAMAVSGKRGPQFWLMAAAAPLLLLMPSVIAGRGVGAGDEGMGTIFLALVFWALLSLTLTLWVAVLRRVLSLTAALLFYGFAWAFSGLADYVSLYVLPYQDIAALKVLILARWVLPQAVSGPGVIDGILTDSGAGWGGLAPTLIQCAALAGVAFWLNRRKPGAAAVKSQGSQEKEA